MNTLLIIIIVLLVAVILLLVSMFIYVDVGIKMILEHIIDLQQSNKQGE